MNLTVLGKYGPFSVNGGSTSGYLLNSDNNYALLDVGSGTVSKMLQKIDINNLKFLFLSHLHFDHISDIGVLSYAVAFLKKDKKLKVYMYNDNSDNAKLLKSIKEFECVDILENKTFNDGGFSFSFYKMTHPVISHGIKISNGKRTLAYTGDTTLNENLVNLIKGSDFLLADGAFTKEDYTEVKPHMSISQVNELSKKYKVKTLVTHVGFKYTDEDVEKELTNNELIGVAKEDKNYDI